MSGIISYGDGDTASTIDALDNFAGAAMHGLSFSCTPIELLSNDGADTVLGHGTGFYWNHGGASHLITNWHVISGRNPFTGELNGNGFVPRRIRYYGTTVSVEGGQIRFGRTDWTADFDDGMVEALAEAPEIDGKTVDIWAFPVAPGTAFGMDSTRPHIPDLTCFINDWQSQRVSTMVGDDCYMLGYPLQNYAGLMPPVWKRGSIASETNIGVGSRPMFLIDSATTPGMSGSPIIRKATTFVGADPTTGVIQENAVCELVGVYAGRLESKGLQATNLGYGWYRTFIPKIIEKYAKNPQWTFLPNEVVKS